MLTAASCGDDGGGSSGDDGGPGGDGDGGDRFPDASTVIADGGPTGGGGACDPGNYQCNDCVDNDDPPDGLVDGEDPECTGSIDDDEGSFATGIPGDNKDDKWQDCFFDGNSGAGDDNCRYHTCCALGAQNGQDCPVDNHFNPNSDCPEQTMMCIEYCAPLTPPGCDCFGCCTICDDAGCEDIYTNPAVAPDCTLETIHDADVCPTCTKNEECNGGECDVEMCTLCPGQTEEDLPDECNNMNECPNEQMACEVSADCGDTSLYCSAGCCISVVE